MYRKRTWMLAAWILALIMSMGQTGTAVMAEETVDMTIDSEASKQADEDTEKEESDNKDVQEQDTSSDEETSHLTQETDQSDEETENNEPLNEKEAAPETNEKLNGVLTEPDETTDSSKTGEPTESAKSDETGNFADNTEQINNKAEQINTVTEDEAAAVDGDTLVECREHVDLLQEGAFVTEHFTAGSGRKRLLRTDNTTALKNCISAAMDAVETEVDISEFGLTRTNDKGVLRAAYASCAQSNHFYVSGRFSYYYSPSTDIISVIVIDYAEDYLDADGNPDIPKIREAKEAFNGRVSEALDYATQGRDSLERVLLAHDWIVRECNYDHENFANDTIPAESYTAYGCLINHYAVCQGYSIAYSYILQKMGIETYILSSDSMNHAWNFINLDGSWLHVDVTWDDPVFSQGTTFMSFYNEDTADLGFINHKYFLKSDDEFNSLNHYDWLVQADDSTAPSSAASGLYENTVFWDSSMTAFNYLGDRFYYTDENGRLCASDDLWGSGEEVIETGADEVYYPHVGGKCILFTDLQDIYAYAPEIGTQAVISADGSNISEMAVMDGSLVYVIVDGEESMAYSCDIPNIFPISIFTIKASSNEGGKISPEGDTSVEEGQSQEYSIVPDEGYEISEVLVDGAGKGSITTYIFEDVVSDHTIEAVFKKKPVQSFKDVPQSYAFYNEIEWASANKIVSGYDDGTFKPQGECKRKQVVAFLWRLKNTPAPASLAARFKDVNTKTNFYKAIYWASENNIVLGFGDGTFRPDDTCTRGQVVAFLWRLAGRPAPRTSAGKFSDVTNTNSFYKAILWASENGIVKGYSDGTFKPDNTCTRGQIVTFIYRYVNLKK